MKITKLFNSLPAPGCWTAVAIALLQTGSAIAADLGRISINDDWRFTKNDPAGITDNLAYPRAARGGRGRGGAPAPAPAPASSPTSGIAQYILPTGNNFIADPAKRYPKPDGNFGADIT